MSKIEDDISRVMAGHDDEAPRAADLPFTAAAAVVAVVIGSVWAGGLLDGRRPAASCRSSGSY